MKKGIIAWLVIGLILAASAPAQAGRYHGYGYHGYRHYHGASSYWGAFGIGILTGSIVANLFYGPPARTVIVDPAPPVVVQPAPVMVQRPYAPINPAAVTGNWVSVATPILNVRSGPGLNFSIIGRVYQGDLLLTTGSAPQWVYVRLPDRSYGWVMTQYTAQTSAPPNG